MAGGATPGRGKSRRNSDDIITPFERNQDGKRDGNVKYSGRVKSVSQRKRPTGSQELNLLANLMGNAVSETEGSSAEVKPVRMNFDNFFVDPDRTSSRDEGRVDIQRIDGTSAWESTAERMGKLGFDNDTDDEGNEAKAEAKGGDSGDEATDEKGVDDLEDKSDFDADDLLDLMDSAK